MVLGSWLALLQDFCNWLYKERGLDGHGFSKLCSGCRHWPGCTHSRDPTPHQASVTSTVHMLCRLFEAEFSLVLSWWGEGYIELLCGHSIVIIKNALSSDTSEARGPFSQQNGWSPHRSLITFGWLYMHAVVLSSGESNVLSIHF